MTGEIAAPAAGGSAATVSVITVNDNGRRFLADIFGSLARQTRPAAEVILVDNASTDDSVAFTRRAFPACG